jgi:polysaccharide pyruvyl transferase WcaK-like protein
MLLAQNIVLMSGCHLVLGPQTIGPFRRSWFRRLALNLLRRAGMVCVRDSQSAICARELGFEGEVTQATDVALDLSFVRDGTQFKAAGRTRVGINVSGLLFNGGYTGRNMFGLKADYATVMRRLLEMFDRRRDCEIHLISHVQSDQLPVEDDRRAALVLSSDFPDSVVAPDFASPSDAKSYIAGMDFFVGARMHACIAAFSSGVPVLPMAYSRKFAGLFGSLGYPHWVDCTKDSEDEIIERVQRAFDGREELARDLAAARAEGGRRLDAYGEKAKGFLARTLEAMP